MTETRIVHRVAVLAFDGVVLGDLSIPLEIFGRVRDEGGNARYEVRVCSINPEVKSEYMQLQVPWRMASVLNADTIIVPGIDSLERPVPPAISRVLQRALERGTRIASICTGAFLLAHAGLLDGLRVTTHWMAAPELARRYPCVKVDADVLYVDNGKVLTSAGAAAGMDLCLHMVRSDCGGVMAAWAARAAVMPLERSGGQAQFIVHEQPEAIESMAPLLVWLEGNLKRRLSLSAMARHAGMSTRTLSRRFREQVGTTPASWITRARIRRAQNLLETTRLSVERIAVEAGFRSASVLREHFGATLGVSPLAYRQSFGHSDNSK